MLDKITIKVGGLFPTLLTVLFVGLKLTNYIDWSWLWVLAPIWIPAALILGSITIFFIIYCILEIIT